ncbi:MAG: hypothetical protein AB2A00_12905, partial [Myxococcota bacterium]
TPTTAPPRPTARKDLEAGLTAFAVAPNKLRGASIFGSGVYFGKKDVIVMACMPTSDEGRAIESDLRWAVANALVRSVYTRNVINLEVKGLQGCPDTGEIIAAAERENADYVVLVELLERKYDNGPHVPVRIRLLDGDGDTKNECRPDGFVVAGYGDSNRVREARARMRFYRMAWSKDWEVSTVAFYSRSGTNYVTTRTPVVRNELNEEVTVADIAEMRGMEPIREKAFRVRTGDQVLSWLSIGRWISCAAVPPAGACLGAAALAPLGLLYGSLGGVNYIPFYLFFALVGGGLAGLAAGSVTGGVSFCGLTAAQDALSIAMRFVRENFVDEAVNLHNRGLAEEYGVQEKDVEEEYFP